MTEEEIEAEYTEWMAKPEAYRKEFNRRWPEVEMQLLVLWIMS